VIVQLGVSLMLVVGSLLVVRGLMSPNRADRGHDVDHTLTLRLSLAGAAFDDAGDRVAYASEVVDRIEGLANVVAAGIANHLPASMSGWTKTNVEAEGRIPRAGEELETTYHPATAGYLTTLQVPLEAGRGFTRQEEVEGGDVVIVSRGMAQALWPNQDPVGRRLRTRLGDPRWLTVIGVVGDVEPARLLGGMNQAPPIQLYVPFAERPPTQIALVVRSIIEPRLMAAPVMAAIREYDARVPVFSVRPMREVLEQVYWIGKFVSQEFAVFGILALLIAAVGAYSVTAYSVSQRTREIGIRIALGARPGKVLRLVVRQGVGFGVGGALLGVALAVPMAVFLGKMFQDVRANDPTVFGGVTILLIGASVLASYVAARKAARVDPVEALAAE
jgi:putative ABC transport system permease protein